MKHPLMKNNITKEDILVLIDFLSQDPIPVLTNGPKVREFEKAWSKWLGIKYSVFVNSGSSANIITLAVLKDMIDLDKNEVIVSPLNWVSDISAILHSGLKPVFCDINFKNLAMSDNEISKNITNKTSVILLTHILGYNGLTHKILDICKEKNILLIEDVCESHGTTFNGKKVGTFGDVSNFSFFYAHHLSSIEGGMICTNNENIYESARTYRSHGMLREMDNIVAKEYLIKQYPDLNKDFIFLNNAYNMRSTEINAVIALNQLSRLDENNNKRNRNLNIFLDTLDSDKYYTKFDKEGNSNYAFTLLLNKANLVLRDQIEQKLKNNGIEFRRGMSGGGNQLRQPYLIQKFGQQHSILFPKCDYVHFFGWYIGNYPDLEEKQILFLTSLLNSI